MSKRLKRKAELHVVEHVFSGKFHFFKVNSRSGERYDVAVQLKCPCMFMSVQGEANSEICSHVLAVLKCIVDEGGIPKNKKSIRAVGKTNYRK